VDAGGVDLDRAARTIVDEAFRRGSPDNLTVQIVVVDAVGSGDALEGLRQLPELALPPPVLEPRSMLDGYRIVRELHASSRSHVYLGVDAETGAKAVLKIPSTDLRGDPAYLERFLMEEWIARRVDNAHVVAAALSSRPRRHLFVATEYIEGQTLAQWMIDNPRPSLDTVRRIVEQIAAGLQAFHRLEMLHQDLRPANVMIDGAGVVKIIDFGAARVAGIEEAKAAAEPQAIPGTEQYAAPEYFVGDAPGPQADLYSLAAIAYQMLSGRLPYGAAVARIRTAADARNLQYRSVLDDTRAVPAWIDGVLRKALHPDPWKRHEALSEFVHDLRHPNPAFTHLGRTPLIERHPARFWKGVSLLLALVVIVLLASRFG
jgi:serine/threonine protein kinase